MNRAAADFGLQRRIVEVQGLKTTNSGLGRERGRRPRHSKANGIPAALNEEWTTGSAMQVHKGNDFHSVDLSFWEQTPPPEARQSLTSRALIVAFRERLTPANHQLCRNAEVLVKWSFSQGGQYSGRWPGERGETKDRRMLIVNCLNRKSMKSLSCIRRRRLHIEALLIRTTDLWVEAPMFLQTVNGSIATFVSSQRCYGSHLTVPDCRRHPLLNFLGLLRLPSGV